MSQFTHICLMFLISPMLTVFTYIYIHVYLMLTDFYQRLPRVYLQFTTHSITDFCLCLPHVHPCLPHVHQFYPVFTSCSPMFTYVYPSIPHVHLCIPYVQSCSPMFTTVYRMFTDFTLRLPHVHSCNVYSCFLPVQSCFMNPVCIPVYLIISSYKLSLTYFKSYILPYLF